MGIYYKHHMVVECHIWGCEELDTTWQEVNTWNFDDNWGQSDHFIVHVEKGIYVNSYLKRKHNGEK